MLYTPLPLVVVEHVAVSAANVTLAPARLTP